MYKVAIIIIVIIIIVALVSWRGKNELPPPQPSFPLAGVWRKWLSMHETTVIDENGKAISESGESHFTMRTKNSGVVINNATEREFRVVYFPNNRAVILFRDDIKAMIHNFPLLTKFPQIAPVTSNDDGQLKLENDGLIFNNYKGIIITMSDVDAMFIGDGDGRDVFMYINFSKSGVMDLAIYDIKNTLLYKGSFR